MVKYLTNMKHTLRKNRLLKRTGVKGSFAINQVLRFASTLALYTFFCKTAARNTQYLSGQQEFKKSTRYL